MIDRVSGVKGTFTAGSGKGFINTDKGLALEFDGSNTVLTYPNNVNISGAQARTMVIRAKANSSIQTSNAMMAVFGAGSTTNAMWVGSSASTSKWMFSFWGSGYDYNTGIAIDTKWHEFIWIYDGASYFGYIDNVLQVTGLATINTTDSPVKIGKHLTTGLYFDGDIANVQMYNHALSTQERNQLYSDFLSRKQRGIIKHNPQRIIKPTDLSSEVGLIAAYNMIPSASGVLVDISGNGNNGTINGALSTKDGMRFDGVDDYVTIPNTHIFGTNDFSYLCRINPFAINGGLFGGNSNAFTLAMIGTKIRSGKRNAVDNTISTGDINLNHDVDVIYTRTNGIGTYYIDGLQAGITVDTNDYSVASTDIGAVDSPSTSLFTGLYIDSIIKNYAITPQQAQDYHNSFKLLTFRDEFRGADGLAKLPQGHIKGTGSYGVEEWDIVQGDLIITPSRNGNFSAGITDWANAGNHTGSIVNGELEVVASGVGGSSSNAVTLSSSSYVRTETTGRVYKWTFQARALSGTPTLRARQSFEIEASAYSDFVLSTEMQTFVIEGARVNLENAYFSLLTAGTFYIDNVSVTEIPPLPNFKSGTQYQKCLVAGTEAIRSKQAHGVWKIPIYKGADGNLTWISFISDITDRSTNSGYLVFLNINETIYLTERSSGSNTSLFETAVSYININTLYEITIVRLASEGVFKDIPTLQVSDLINVPADPYDVFEGHRYGFYAENNSVGLALASTVDEIPLVNTVKYQVEFDATLISGSLPIFALSATVSGGPISNIETVLEGRNSVILTCTQTTTGVIWFFNNGTVVKYKISGLTIRRIYDAHTFAAFIEGGAFTEKTLIDVSGGSGSNPVTDSTYLTSEFMVNDLDVNDIIFPVKTWNQQ